MRFTLIEAVGRKCAFLSEALSRLGLTERVEVACARSEELTVPGAPAREAFAVVLAKAVGSLAVVVELAAPALRPGGLLLVSKTAATAARGTAPLARSPLPGSVGVVYEKVAPTPERFPRRPGMAAKRPLA